MKPRYILDKDFENSYGSKYYRSEIKANDFCIPFGGSFRIYSGTLAALLTAEEVPVIIDTTECKVVWETIGESNGTILERPNVTESGERKQGFIQGQDYIESYRVGYQQGVEWFKEEYNPIPTVIYGPNVASFITDLHDLLYHNYEADGIGLMAFKGWMLNTISQDSIQDSGFHSGVIAQIEILITRRSSIREGLRNYSHKTADMMNSELSDIDSDFEKNTIESMQNSALGDEEKSSTLFISKEIQNILYRHIEPYVREAQYKSLLDLIAGSAPQEPIIVHCQQNELANAFVKSGAVANGRAELFSKILPKFFVRHDGKRTIPLTSSTLVKHLRSRNLPK